MSACICNICSRVCDCLINLIKLILMTLICRCCKFKYKHYCSKKDDDSVDKETAKKCQEEKKRCIEEGRRKYEQDKMREACEQERRRRCMEPPRTKRTVSAAALDTSGEGDGVVVLKDEGATLDGIKEDDVQKEKLKEEQKEKEEDEKTAAIEEETPKDVKEAEVTEAKTTKR